MNQRLLLRLLLAGLCSTSVLACGDEDEPKNPVDTTDSDRDGIPDELEAAMGYDPTKTDTDRNGIADGDEDYDGDGLTNRIEILLGLDPMKTDTDGNGTPDGEEDYDGDGRNNLTEAWSPWWDPASTTNDQNPYVCTDSSPAHGAYDNINYRFTSLEIRTPGIDAIGGVLSGLSQTDIVNHVLNVLVPVRGMLRSNCYSEFTLSGGAGDAVCDEGDAVCAGASAGRDGEPIGYRFQDEEGLTHVRSFVVSLNDTTVYFETQQLLSLGFPIILPGGNGTKILPLTNLHASGTIVQEADGELLLEGELRASILFDDGELEITLDGNVFQTINKMLTRDNGEPFSPFYYPGETEPAGHYIEATLQGRVTTIID